MVDSEEALIRAARSGDRPAFEELVRRTTKLVFARLYLETGDTHRAEDLLQETYLTAFRSIGRLEDPKGFRAWLMRIAQNLAIDAGRREMRQKRMAPSRPPDPRDPAPERPEAEEARRRALAALRSLPEEYRIPLTLRYLAGADYETIGMQLGLTNGSLRGLLNRGMALLRAEMKRAVGSEVAGG